MSFHFSTKLLICGMAMLIPFSNPASASARAKTTSPLIIAQASPASCATRSGPVADSVVVVVNCINAEALACPAGRGSLYECRNGKWYCIQGMHDQPCLSGEAGAWVWTSDGLQRAQ
jgi:hypothetical protein